VRILIINPNTSAGITARIMAAAQPLAAPGTELVPLTAARGVPYIATRAEAAIGAAVVLEMLAEHHREADAAVIAAFGDPGLGGARELFPIPVVGLAEAGMLTACMLGRRFGIVSFARSLAPWFEECVAWHGLGERCAGVRTLDGDFVSIDDVQDEKEDLLVDLASRAAAEDGADVVLLAGAPLAGLAGRVRDRVPVPVIDCVGAAVLQAQTLVALAPRKAVTGTYRRPDPKISIGLAPALAQWLAHR
jgi:allantoin racemase